MYSKPAEQTIRLCRHGEGGGGVGEEGNFISPNASKH